MRAIDRADVALLLIDAVEGVTAQDTHVAGHILEAQKSAVVVVNKWDALVKDSHTMSEYARQVREQLAFLDYVPVIFISAKTHQRIHQVLPTALRVVEARRHRLSTSEFNDVLRAAYDGIQAPSKQGRPLRVYYGTQVGNEPPTFVIFVNDVEIVHFSYERYLENRIREYYPFEGTPIKLIFRARRNEDE
jgi:GTP-binding protein